MGERVGILGGGQLARMLLEAADDLGIAAMAAANNSDHSCTDMPNFSSHDNWEQAASCLSRAEVMTFDREDLGPSDFGTPSVTCRPEIRSLLISQDRLPQKQLLDQLDIPTSPWAEATPGSESAIIENVGLPVMVKARRGGFDGRGQIKVETPEELTAAIAHFESVGAIAEKLIPFTEEFACQVTRDTADRIVSFPLVRTCQVNGQLAWALAPHPDAAALEERVFDWAARIVRELNHVGTFAVEFFRNGNEILVNEIAPRVHNSGHGSIEGCATSQFANHILATAGEDVRDPEPKSHTLVLNCIGEMPQTPASEGIAPHDYHKDARENRKVGHITLYANSFQELEPLADKLPEHLKASAKHALSGV